MAEEYSPSNPNQPSRLRLRLLFLLVVVGAFLLFLGITGMRIVGAAGEGPSRKADAIVVFGAAEYAGRPSPVYRARLDHAFELFELPLYHSDPFDRQIIAQALSEKVPVVTSDEKFSLYKGLKLIW